MRWALGEGRGDGDGLAEGNLEFPEERHWDSENEGVGARELEVSVKVSYSWLTGRLESLLPESSAF